jgi:Family of unknown function (DUF5946)
MTTKDLNVACPGCGVELPELDGPAPAHLGASPACWALYARLLVREYGDLADGLVHRLTVATYAVQHPDGSRHRSPESTALQLIALCLVLERGASAQGTTTLLASVLEQPPAFPWLEPPRPNGTLNVSDVAAARTPAEHARLVVQWARDVWSSWAPHHTTVGGWIDASLGGPPTDPT